MSSVAAPERCRTSCEADAMCQGATTSGCTTVNTCHGWPGKAWRQEVADAYLRCQQGCPKDPSACSAAAIAAAGAARPADTDYADACAMKKSKCAGSFRNDTCGEQTLYEASAVATARACLDQECAMVAGCVDAAFE
jgi:hypothetical protein